MSAIALDMAVSMDHRKLAERLVELSERVDELRQEVHDKDELIEKLSRELVKRNRDMAFLQGTRIPAFSMH